MPIKSTAIVRKRKSTSSTFSQSDVSSEDDYVVEQNSDYDDEDDFNMSSEDCNLENINGVGKKHERQLMRDWLIDQVNENEHTGKIPGLKWMDKEKTLIKIPWTHASRHGWEADRDSSLFKEWAIHTGKYKSGDKDPDAGPKRWKANFRCAMNSLPDIVADGTKSRKKGHDAFRVYRLLPQKPRPSQLKKTQYVKSSDQQQYKRYATKADRLEAHRNVKDNLKRKLHLPVQQLTNDEPTLKVCKNEKLSISPTEILHFNNGTNVQSSPSRQNSSEFSANGCAISDRKGPMIIPKLYCENGNGGINVRITQPSFNNNNNTGSTDPNLYVGSIASNDVEHSYARSIDLRIPSFVEMEEDDPTSDYNSGSPHSTGSLSPNEAELLEPNHQEYQSNIMFSEPSTPTTSTITSGIGVPFMRSDSIEFVSNSTPWFQYLPSSTSIPTVGAAMSTLYTNTYTTSVNTSPSYHELHFGDI